MGDVRLVDGAGVEEGAHQPVLVELAPKVQSGAVLPGVPDGSQGQDELAQSRGRRVPSHAEAALDVGFHLGAQAQDEPALGHLGQVPGDVGGAHRVAGKGHGDGRAQLDPLGVLGRQGQGQKRIVLRLAGPQTVKTDFLGHLRHLRRIVQIVSYQSGVDFHCEAPCDQ